MTREQMYDTIDYLTVVMKFSAQDTVATIREATGLTVNLTLMTCWRL